MKSSMTKARIFTLIAFGILMYWFVIPAVFTHDVVELARIGKADQIPKISYKVWDYYAKGMYVSPSAPKEAIGNLKKMIEEDGELFVVSAPIWYVALEAPNDYLIREMPAPGMAGSTPLEYTVIIDVDTSVEIAFGNYDNTKKLYLPLLISPTP